MHCPKKT